jgi:NhaP-type Na+/H+ or K+/H+ antiporter
MELARLAQLAEFGVEPVHILYAALGASLLLAYWLPRLVFQRPPSSSALLIGFGMLGSVLFPGIFAGLDPTLNPAIWEVTAEIVVIVVLFATGLRIDDLGGWPLWRPTVGLLAVTMPLTIAAVALVGWTMTGLTLAGAVLLGAVLAPTDPVLAGDVQVGPPLEGREHPVRFGLTTEAGLNDGLAFPFVYLALHIAAGGFDTATLAAWLVWDVLYRITVGALLGAAVGWMLGRILFVNPSWSTLAETGPGVLALAGVLLAYGLVELAEGYGFIAAFVAGVVVRRAEARHALHRRLHVFSEAIESAATAVLLVLLGGVMPTLWPHLDWRHAVVGFGLLLLIRPLAGLAGLIGSARTWRERGVLAFYGVRGIGSIYYLGYASTHVEFINEGPIWALVAFTIFASTVIHGLTARETVRLLLHDDDSAEPSGEPPGPAV